jgi:NADH:ubiquinone oxidoreductase subunit 4 (subunit M)
MVILAVCSHETLQLTAAFSLRNSLWVALIGMAIIVRALEARHGRLSLFQNHGFYESTPMLGIAFLVCGLGCVGFPGTSAFISFEMLADEIIPSSPFFGIVIVFSEALISISLLMVYFKLFCGKKVEWSDIFKVRLREMIALWIIIFLIFGLRFLPLTDIATTHHNLEKSGPQQPH